MASSAAGERDTDALVVGEKYPRIANLQQDDVAMGAFRSESADRHVIGVRKSSQRMRKKLKE